MRARSPRRVPRYRCPHCRRTFSSQTFSPSYWLKRPDLLVPVFDGLANCVALRQLARIHAVSPATIQTQSQRLGRHCLLWLRRHPAPVLPPREACVIDGFESFAYSQYHPLHVHLAVGADSHLIYGFSASPLRRKGRMTPFQKRKRARLEARHGRPDPRAIERDMAQVLRLVAPRGGALRVRSDEHPAYPRALRRVRGLRVVHERTPSTAARTVGNPLFPVNRADLLIRHGGANHKRQTIAFSKRLGAVLERIAVYATWHNFQKSRSEKKRDATPAESLGAIDRKLTTREILQERLFPSQVALPEVWRPIYERRVQTWALPAPRPHTLRYAT